MTTAQPTMGAIASDAAPVARFLEAERAFFEHSGVAVRSSFVELPRPRLRARLLEAGAGDPILLLHGGGGSAGLFAPLMACLPAARLVAPDRPGHGLTDAFTYRGVDLRRHAVDFVGSMAELLGERPLRILANSMGALWALWYALEHPERVARLVLVGCPALLLGTSGPLGFRLLSVKRLNEIMFGTEPASPKQTRTLVRRMGHDPDRIATEFMTYMQRIEELPAYRDAWLSLLETSLAARGPRKHLALGESELRRVVQPTLFLWGANDPFGTADVGRRACSLMPDARLEVVGAGHLPWLDDALRCGRLASEFLADRG
jgi:pimeloyl-ACP methyl ester carboxylesterase